MRYSISSTMLFIILICLNYGHTRGKTIEVPNVSTTASGASKKEVSIYVGDMTGLFNLPVEALSKALRQNGQASKFRVSWSSLVFTTGNRATVLYDRQAEIIKYYSVGNVDNHAYEEHCSYCGVTDEIIYKLAKSHYHTTEGTGASFFSELTHYGCKRRELA